MHYNPKEDEPTFKWIASYADGHTESAECDDTGVISKNEITKENLVSVEIGDCVNSIAGGAFLEYYSLKNCTIGSGVSSIGGAAFNNCTGLTSVTINAVVPPTLGNNYVFNNTNRAPIYVPSESLNDYKTADKWSGLADRLFPIE